MLDCVTLHCNFKRKSYLHLKKDYIKIYQHPISPGCYFFQLISIEKVKTLAQIANHYNVPSLIQTDLTYNI